MPTDNMALRTLEKDKFDLDGNNKVIIRTSANITNTSLDVNVTNTTLSTNSNITNASLITKDITYNKLNTFDHVKTSIGTGATKVNISESAIKIKLIHRSETTIYLGKDATVTTTNGFPLIKNEYLELDVTKNNENNIYAIVSTDTVDLYAIAMVKE